MLIVDSQVHIWAADTPQRPWAKNAKPHRPQPFGMDKLLGEMNAAGVDRAVIVPPSLERTRNDLALDAARAQPERFAVMGKIDTAAPLAPGALAQLREQAGMLGLRFNFKKNMTKLSDPQQLAGVWREAEAAGLPVYIGVTHEHVHWVEDIAVRHPRLRLIFDHMALAGGIKDEAAFAGLDQLLAAAKHPNLAVKVSALPAYSTAPYPFTNLHPYVRRVYDAFGPQRMLWGSDLTRIKNASYRQCVTAFTEEMPWLSAADLEWIMGRALCQWLSWKPAAPAR